MPTLPRAGRTQPPGCSLSVITKYGWLVAVPTTGLLVTLRNCSRAPTVTTFLAVPGDSCSRRVPGLDPARIPVARVAAKTPAATAADPSPRAARPARPRQSSPPPGHAPPTPRSSNCCWPPSPQPAPPAPASRIRVHPGQQRQNPRRRAKPRKLALVTEPWALLTVEDITPLPKMVPHHVRPVPQGVRVRKVPAQPVGQVRMRSPPRNQPPPPPRWCRSTQVARVGHRVGRRFQPHPRQVIGGGAGAGRLH